MESNLLPKEILNGRNQVVGYYNQDDNTYHTQRDKSRGELFVKKTEFEGKFIPNGIAIDRDILRRLMAVGCKKINIVIKNDLSYSYSVSITPKEILEHGVKINFDKINSDGVGTGFGEQYVFSLTEDCHRLDLNQKTL